ncbi:unnamed protein product [Oncorhynchus mykiss]|uniref:PiggyBac transposable element-derived protein domain-containing protein n=1 Tax=Oncorhynchus mykiss TaxID=8022 RepID=A0A060Y9E4_ONCMY|nr:unnamed protein product [Oncorhynchus mykiss]
MPFRSRCPFRQYIQSKYGIKIWADCDAASSYVWNLQECTGKLQPQLLNTWNRSINSSKFVFTADACLVSFVPKKGILVVLMSMLHRDGRICGREHQNTEILIDSNASKDNLDKLLTGYSCKRRTLLWPLVIFFNIFDVSAYNTFVIWMALIPEWNRGKLQRRQLFLEELGKAYPKDPSFCSHREEDSGGGCWCPIRPTHRTNNSNTGNCSR